MCFFSPIRNDPKKTHKQIFGTHPVPGQSRKFVYVYVFFLSLRILVLSALRHGIATGVQTPSSSFFLCNEVGPFQVLAGDFQAILGPFLAIFRLFSGKLRQLYFRSF